MESTIQFKKEKHEGIKKLHKDWGTANKLIKGPHNLLKKKWGKRSPAMVEKIRRQNISPSENHQKPRLYGRAWGRNATM